MATQINKSSKFILSNRIIVGLAIVFSLLLYSNTLRNGYNLDDELVTINHRLTSKGISAIPEIFASPYYQDEMGYSYEYRPVTLVSFAIEHQLFGDSPLASHFFNIVLYVLCVVIFAKVVSRMFAGNNHFFLLFSILLFVVHPLHTEVVASIKNRDELLSLSGGLIAFYFAFKFIEKGNYLYLILITFFLWAGLLSKMSVFSFLLIIPVWLIVSDVHGKKIIYVTISLMLAGGSVLFMKKFHSSQIIIVGIGIPLLLFLAFLFHRVKIMGYLSFNNIRKLFSNPDSSIKNKLNKSDVIIFGISIAAILYGYSTQNLIPLIPVFAATLLLPYLNKAYSFFNLLLPAFLIAFLDFTIKIKHIEWLYFIYLLSILRGIKGSIQFSVFIYLGVIIAFSISYCLRKLTFLPDLQYLILPALLISIDIVSKKYMLQKKNIIWFWCIMLFSIILVSLLLLKQLDLALIIFPFFGILFQVITPIKIKHILLVSIWALFAFIVFNIPSPFVKIYFKETIEFETYSRYQSSLEERDSLVVNAKARAVENPNKVIDSKEDRPIDFVEFPLGFNPTFSEKYGTVSYVLGYYLKLMAIPYPMCFYYGFNKINVVQLSSPWAILSILLHLFLGISALYFIRKHPVYSIGVFAYLSSIFLFSNLASPVAGMIGDRLTFVASFGFCIAVGYALSQFYERVSAQNKKIIIAGFFIVLVLYSGLTIARNAQWKDHMTLYKHDIKHLEESAQAHNLLAKRLMLESFQARSPKAQYDMRVEGIKHYEKAIAIYPDFFNPHIDLGKAYLLVNRLDDAARMYLKAAEMDTTYYDSWLQAGGIFVQLQKYPQAIFCFEKVIAKDSSYFQAYISLSEVYFRQMNFEKALEVNMEAIKKFPGLYDPVVNTGKTYFTMGDKKNALIYFEKAYLINPNDRNLVLTIAGIYRDIGEKDKADFYFSRANQNVR